MAKELTRAETIRDLEALAEYFKEETGGAVPLAIIQAAKYLKEDIKDGKI